MADKPENPALDIPGGKADATPAGSAGKPPSSDAAKRENTTTKPASGRKASGARKSGRKASTANRGSGKVTQRGDQAPEAKRTQAEKRSAAQSLFTDADTASRLGLPPTLTVEQHENNVRRAALGY